MILLLAGFLAASSLTRQTPASPALKVVVIAGEDAVNIIQRKTAVAPVVEVRDRNGLPVAGASVTFTISGGNTASFAGGAQTVTLTTNAAGRAAVGALNPLGSGAFQINVQAAFQGQTAVAAIAQTNVMTAAEAAAATGAGASSGGGAGATGGGAAAGGGGGLSATTIAIVGGAVAGGAIVVKEVQSQSSATIYKGNYSGTINSVFPPALSFCTRTIAHSGTVQVELQVESNGNVGGEGSVNGTSVMSSFSGAQICAITTATQTHGIGAPMTGTKNALAFNGSHPGVPGVTATYDFTGSLNGDVIVGTFTFTLSAADGVDRGVFAVTLQKQ